jgi:hypothetical protein
VQDFVVKYKRPFKASELMDFSLVAKQEYNLTSAYGCYLKTETNQGTNPDALFKDGVGCQGKWQAVTSNIIFTEYRPDIDGEFSMSAMEQSYTVNEAG